MNSEKEVCKEIGSKLRSLRVERGFSSYENFAIEHELSRMQYWRVEKGLTNITIRSLVKLLNIHKITVEDFFSDLNFSKPEGKSKKPAKRIGRSRK